jgi:replicative superfamily II helicase
MPPLIKAEDQMVLAATSEYPYAKWKFEKFNPVQSRVMEYYDKDVNGLIAAMTSAGKTVVAEMFLAHEVRKRGGKGMFLAPLRALGREKYMEWSDKKYHFNDLKASICTGDYRLTKDRASELAQANLIIMTSEMLNHCSRNHKAEQNNWLLDVGTLVIDESHLLTVAGRGDHLEVGLMKFTEINPKARLVLLSATMPNVEEIAEWISYSLTKKDTFVLKSKYRPVPLTTHYEPYCDDMRRYDLIEEEKVNKALEIIEWYKDDKFLVFAHTKRTGEMMKQRLKEINVEAQFHNADLESSERAKVEDRFRNDPKLRVIVATSTLAWGLNLPARRVIILGVNRGLSEVEPHDIIQMVGRSGRLGIDPMGDAYILVPESKEKEYRQKLSKPGRIESQLLEKAGDHHKVLAFHLVSEIHHGDIETTEDVHRWYKRSLAYFQNKELDETVVDNTLELLRKKGAIWQDDGKWTCRPIGKVASMFYFSPFDVSDLYFNFKNLFEQGKEGDDYMLAMALANIDSNHSGVVSRLEKDEMSLFQNKVQSMVGYSTQGSLKAGFCYFNLLNGTNTVACSAMQRNLQFDYNRLSQVLQALDSMSGQWGMDGFFRQLEGRIVNGVPGHLVDLCRIPNIGRVRAKKLYEHGIKTAEEFADMEPEKVRKLLNMKPDVVKQLMADAQRVALPFFGAESPYIVDATPTSERPKGARRGGSPLG